MTCPGFESENDGRFGLEMLKGFGWAVTCEMGMACVRVVLYVLLVGV